MGEGSFLNFCCVSTGKVQKSIVSHSFCSYSMLILLWHSRSPGPSTHDAQDSDKGCQAVLSDQSCGFGTEHVGTNVLEHLLPFASGEMTFQDTFDWTIWDKIQFFFTQKCVPYMRCTVHGQQCMLDEAELGVAGFPCVDYSPAGNQACIAGRTFPVLLVILRWHRVRRTRVLFLENVPEFPKEAVQQLMSDMYDIEYFYMTPADCGCEYLSPMRLFMVLFLRGQCCKPTQNLNWHVVLIWCFLWGMGGWN